MRTLTLEGQTGACAVILGESIANLGNYCAAAKRVIVTDRNVRRYHGERFARFDVVEIEPGEEHKTLQTVERLYERFLALELDRSSVVIGVGGGVVTDVTGHAAATYLRGLPFGFVPTTLLAQVDASIGGKNGVNFRGYKNLIGGIQQPRFCVCDFDLLATLPVQELRYGFAEVVKHAAIGDGVFFSYLEERWADAFALHRPAIERVVHDSLAVKIRIVRRDERERGERMQLNFGHTLGHAIEKVAGIPHGAAVSMGMVAAARLSVARGDLRQQDAERLKSLLAAMGLPTGLETEKIDKAAVLDALRRDKKRFGGRINMALLEGIGTAKIATVGFDELEASVDDLH